MASNRSLRCAGCRGTSHVLGVRVWDKVMAEEGWIETMYGVCPQCGRLWSANVMTHRDGTMSTRTNSYTLEDVRPTEVIDTVPAHRQLGG